MQKPIVLISIIVSIIVALIFLILSTLSSGNRSNPGNNNQVSSITIDKADPSSSTPLIVGTQPIFTLYFNTAVYKDQVTIVLQKKNIIQDTQYSKIQFYSDFSSDNKSLRVKMGETVADNTAYYLEISDTRTKTTLFSNTYSSASPPPTFIPSNNLSLSQFLPYETSSYTLVYNTYQNLYVMHFIYNPDSADSPDTQFEKAKADATAFIKSKGIDINSIKIEFSRK